MQDRKKFITRRQALLAGAAGSLAAFSAGAISLPALHAHAAADPQAESSLPVKEIEDIFQTKGTLEPGGVLLIELARSDIHATIFGISIKPDLAIDTEITFQPLDNRAIVKYEFVLLDGEVNSVLDELLKQDLQPATTAINALHNHFLEMDPHIKYLHGTAIGDPLDLAHALHKALSQSGQPFAASVATQTGLPNKQIEQIIGGTGMISDSVLSVSVNRKETIRELGFVLQPAMQVQSTFNFQAIDNNQAAEAAEFILLPQEVDAVSRSLRNHNLKVTAVHNHELFIQPTFYYLHAFGTGSPLSLAQATHAALQHTNSALK
ncbi:DUF1259 domain-containing protein [Ktedonosporobacter rubrisoli]|uniref:DUF1259 domain-containing protein n=1 Tax=Ktedonosporobacter rubrisoli TaxID=2509675 RepID=A0A4P6JIU0_KTERU|nr:DUF1259 domain-containing protein [Ktedonosporobacter rubrisoli]QBD74988.1 DUF1259 domain-containing protein [Ktedonosporobacter rubrisoli]